MTEPAGRARSLGPLAVPAAAAVTLAVATFRLRFGIDDAFINFRFAENLAAGLGPVFNAGERVEGYTTPAWVFLLAGLHRLGAPLLGTAHVLGIAAAATTVLVAGALATRAAPRLGALAGAFAAVLVALHPGVVLWTASGMETCIFLLLVLLGVAAGTMTEAAALAGVLCGLAAITRPEAVLFGALVGAALAARAGRAAAVR